MADETPQAEDRPVRTTMTEEKFNNYNKWCSRTTNQSFDNNNRYQNNNKNNNNNRNNDYQQPAKRRFYGNEDQQQPEQQQQYNNNYNQQGQGGGNKRWDTDSSQNKQHTPFTFNPNAYYHPSMLQDPWSNVNNRRKM